MKFSRPLCANFFDPRFLRRLLLAGGTLLFAADTARADTASVVSAANTLTTSASSVSTAYSLSTAKQWTNLPGGTRNGPTIGGGTLATSSDISATARTAALTLAQTALSTAGYNTMNEIRLADDVIRSSAAGSGQSWNYSNYHIATLGTPSTITPWMLQISGHHLTYNITYNGPYVSATPLFLGTEPPDYYRLSSSNATYPNYAAVKGTINGTTSYIITNPDKTANGSSSNVVTTTTDPGVASGTKHSPLETQRAAISVLAASLQSDNTGAKLSGTFSDVVMGVTNNGDGNFPFIGTNPTYPTGTSGRGLLYGSLTTSEKAQVKVMIEAWVKTQASDVSLSLLADYESDAALAATYVGYQVGAGSADGGTTRANFDADINAETTPVNSQNSYIRVDGPRVWIEFVVQAAVAYQSQKFVHYHSLWRDKLADYGNEFGGYLDTTSTSTTYTRPGITTQPASYSVSAGGSATFSVVATGTRTLAYQWYVDGSIISGATSASYTVSDATASDAGSYSVVVSNLYGVTTSSGGTLTVTTVTGTTPAITTQPVSLSVNAGDSATFSVVATGSGTLAYQWYKGTVAISGATDASYTINAATAADAGTYDVVVINNVGSATSSGASLTVTTTTGTTPAITTQPVSQSVLVGNSVTFTVAASGTATLTYQWYKDNAAISGATESVYTISSVAASDAGVYFVTVSNLVGSVSSDSTVLTVTSASLPVVTCKVGGDGYLYEASPASHKGKVIFTRTGDTSSDLTVYYRIKGNATNGADFTGPGGAALTGTLVIPAGSSTYKLKLTAVDDGDAEGTEQVAIRLLASPDSTYTVGTTFRARLYIVDND